MSCGQPQSTYIFKVRCLASSKILTPNPPLHPASVSSPRTKGGGYTLAGRWGGGGSIFWKTPDIGLASYSLIPLRGQQTFTVQQFNFLTQYMYLFTFSPSFCLLICRTGTVLSVSAVGPPCAAACPGRTGWKRVKVSGAPKGRGAGLARPPASRATSTSPCNTTSNSICNTKETGDLFVVVRT